MEDDEPTVDVTELGLGSIPVVDAQFLLAYEISCLPTEPEMTC